MSIDMALPSPVELPNVKSVRLSAEHTAIELHVADQSIKVGDRLEFIVGYSDTTVHLHDQIYGTRNGQVESIWDIQARGRLR